MSKMCAECRGGEPGLSVTRDAELHGNSLVGVPDHTPLRSADPDTLTDRGSRLKLEGGAAQAWSAPDWLRQAM